ncbi:hypothetical protein VP01_3708g2, partial [Puccinia sorghi]
GKPVYCHTLRFSSVTYHPVTHSLYKEACRQAALNYSHQVSTRGSYTYMNINKRYTTDLQLLIPEYNHYVHFLQTNQLNREKHQLGKFCQEGEHKVIKRARDCMPDYDLLLPNLFQKHTIKLYPTSTATTLNFRSENATRFFCRLDAAMFWHPMCWRINVFKDAYGFPSNPSGITLSPTTHRPSSQLLLILQAPSKKLSKKKFTQTFFDHLSVPYILTNEMNKDQDDEESMDKGDSNYSGPEEDLYNTSGKDNESVEELRTTLITKIKTGIIKKKKKMGIMMKVTKKKDTMQCYLIKIGSVDTYGD